METKFSTNIKHFYEYNARKIAKKIVKKYNFFSLFEILNDLY